MENYVQLWRTQILPTSNLVSSKTRRTAKAFDLEFHNGRTVKNYRKTYHQNKPAIN